MEITITLNGTKISIANCSTLYDLLEVKGWKMVPMSIKIDGELIPRKDYAAMSLKEGQTLSITPFLAGG